MFLLFEQAPSLFLRPTLASLFLLAWKKYMLLMLWVTQKSLLTTGPTINTAHINVVSVNTTVRPAPSRSPYTQDRPTSGYIGSTMALHVVVWLLFTFQTIWFAEWAWKKDERIISKFLSLESHFISTFIKYIPVTCYIPPEWEEHAPQLILIDNRLILSY